MTIKATGKVKTRVIAAIILSLAGAGAAIYLDLARGKFRWGWLALIFGAIFIYALYNSVVCLRKFVFSKEGITVKYLFFKKLYRYEDLDVTAEKHMIEPPSRRGRGFAYGATQAGAGGPKSSGTYLSGYENINTGRRQMCEMVCFYKKSAKNRKTTDSYQFLHPLSFIRIFLYSGDGLDSIYHIADRDKFKETLASFGITLPEAK